MCMQHSEIIIIECNETCNIKTNGLLVSIAVVRSKANDTINSIYLFEKNRLMWCATCSKPFNIFFNLWTTNIISKLLSHAANRPEAQCKYIKGRKECNLKSKCETIESSPLLLLSFLNETGLSIRHTHIHFNLYSVYGYN